MAHFPFFFQEDILRSGATLELSEETAKHVVQVLRKQEGDRIILSNGRGSSAEAEIVAAGKKRCSVQLGTVAEYNKPLFSLHLCIAFTKNASRNEWLLEKATELGVGSITPLISARTEREKFRADRAQSILISAMLQSRQYFLPALHTPASIEQILEQPVLPEQKLIAHCDEQYARQAFNAVVQPGRDTIVLIGPEGDFTAGEIGLATQKGFKGISLCTQRLRTETAAMAVCAYFNLLNHA